MSAVGNTEALLTGGTRLSSRVRMTMIGAVLALLFSFSLALSPVAEAHIYWSTGSSIGRANLDGTGVDENFITGTCMSFGLAVDESYLYWTNAECHSIGRANTDGTGADQNFITGLDQAGGHPAKPEGLAVDAAHLYFYMLNGAANIGRANIDGSNVEEQWKTIGSQPGGWGVEVDGAHIYFAGYSGIGRMNLDGSGYNEQFIDLGYPPLEVAVDGAHIFWTLGSSIGRANLDGSGVNQNFITGAGLSAGIVVGNGHIYWTNGYSIARANLDGTEVDLNFITGVFANTSLALDPPHVPDYMILSCDPPEVNAGGSTKCIADVLDQSGEGIPATGTVSFTASGGTLSANTCTLNTYSYCGVDWYPPADGIPGKSYSIEAHYNGDSTFLPGDFPYPAQVQIGAAGGSPQPPPGNPPTWREGVLHELFLQYPEAFTEALVGNLEASGFQVSEGYPKLWTKADCANNYPVYHNCFGNNPAAPYVVPVVKSWPDEYVDPAMVNGVVVTLPGYSATYRLDPREAIIVFGRMPPPARYMGLQTYIWTTGWAREHSPWDQEACSHYKFFAKEMTQYFFATFPPESTEPHCLTVPDTPGRLQSFSSIDNNINNVVMETQSGPPWDKMRYFVITPDKVTDAAVREALGSLGVVEGEIFTEEIPETFQDPDHLPPYPYGQNPVVGPLGLGEDAVDFLTGLRYAMPEDEQAADTWREGLPLTVLRVRRPSSGPAPEPYGDSVADDRPGVDESGLGLGDDLDALVDAVIARAQSQGWVLAIDPDQTNPEPMVDILNELGQFGPACREIGMDCLGDGADASYFFAPPRPLDTGRIYAAVGTLATETGNATYVGLSVNDASLLKGVLNVDDTDTDGDTQLKGSAGSYAGQVPNAEKFFVHFFTRDCAAIAGLTDPGACTTITTDMVPLAGDDEAPGDPELHGMFSMGVRAYVVPGFERGADPTLQLRPYTLTFSYE